MSARLEDSVRDREPEPAPDDVLVKSYRYLRTAMVGLLVALGVAVGYQTWQEGHLLSSVSAYYYTPAQAIFVGALIGLAACMIALKGTTGAEDILLNLGGMVAAVVAIVPTSRGEDYRAAVRACRTGGTIPGADCPTVQALEQATKANVENNTVVLLVVGGLGLAATVLFARRGRPRTDLNPVGFLAAVAVLLVAAVTFVWFRERFIDTAHYVAAGLLFLCILAVALENARRYNTERSSAASDGGRAGYAAVLLPRRRPAPYVVVAWAMLAVAVFGVLLWSLDVITLFTLEILVAALFVAFWTVQTIEQSGHRR